MKGLVAVTCVLFFVNAHGRIQSSNFRLEKQWQEFKIKFHKHYDTLEEETMRRSIWKSTLEAVEKHNREYELGLQSYTKGINKFSDLTKEEFKRRYNGLDPSRKPQTYNLHKVTNETLPDSVDWRSKGYVTPVKDQNPCGTCWAFSTTGALEGQYYRFHKTLVSFSEQQLVDCGRDFGTGGCHGKGAYHEWAYEYIKKFGIENDTVYPYIHEDGKCQYDASKVITKVSGYMTLPIGDEAALKHAVATVGPIAVNIAAEEFGTYTGGVFNDPYCDQLGIDHAVLVVGYGRQNGQDYWLVKNSWGTDFGEDGYIKMSRNKNNQCFIASEAVYPLLETN